MAKKMFVMLGALGVILLVLGFVKYRQVQAAIQQGKSYVPPPEAVTTIVASQDKWQTTLGVIGTVTAAKGVTVSADLPGIIVSIEFESGKQVQSGDVLVRLDTRQEEAQLAAAEAQQQLTKVNLDRMQSLLQKEVVSQAEFDQAKAQADEAAAHVHEIQATIERKTIRAPFSGKLGIRQVNLGEYVSAGESIVALQALDPVYVDFAVPQQNLADVAVGSTVELSADGAAGVSATGKISAINSLIDQSTRNVNVRATFPNSTGKLMPGMFVDAKVLVGRTQPVIALPASSISYTSYGDFVFIVEDVKGPDGNTYLGLRQQIVTLGNSRGDQIAIVDGIKPGEQVVTSGVFKLRSGQAVVVSNDVQPSNNPTPHPEES